MERVHAQRQMADVGKLVQASATVVTDNDLRHTAVVAAKAKPRLRGQLQRATCEVADDVLVTHQHDVLFGSIVAAFSSSECIGLRGIKFGRLGLVIRHAMTCKWVNATGFKAPRTMHAAVLDALSRIICSDNCKELTILPERGLYASRLLVNS